MTTARPEPAPRPRPAGSPDLRLSVWPTAQRDARTQRRGRYLPESTAHPAKMLPAIAATAISRYTEPGDLVADPMCGIGTTLVEAVHLGRDGLGIEYEDRWAGVAAANVAHARRQGATGTAEVIRGDARQLPALLPPGTAGRAALVVTSPPYGPSRPRPGQGRAAARRGGRGPQVRQPLRPGPGQPRPPGPGRTPRRVHRDPGRLRGAAAPRRAGRGHRPALARSTASWSTCPPPSSPPAPARAWSRSPAASPCSPGCAAAG